MKILHLTPTKKNADQKVESFSSGSVAILAERQRSQERTLFCQSCHEKWEQEIPKTYSVYRMACPHCKTETHGNILTILERY